MPLPQLNGEQLRVLNGMNNYWQEIAGRDEPRRTHCGKEEIEVLLSVIKPTDVLLIIGNYVSNYGQTIPYVPFDLKPYIHHHPDCALNQNWDEAAQALADTPAGDRDEGYYQAVNELEEKRTTCTCGYTTILKSQK